jgi:hypothetical protein
MRERKMTVHVRMTLTDTEMAAAAAVEVAEGLEDHKEEKWVVGEEEEKVVVTAQPTTTER